MAHPSRRRPAWGRIGSLFACLVCTAFLIRAVADHWAAVRDVMVDADLGWLALGWVLALTAMSSIALTWRSAQAVVVRMLRSEATLPLGRLDTVTLYFRGELGKYVPGAIWAGVGRAELAHRCGLPRLAAYAGVTLSLVALYLACAVVAAGARLATAGDLAPVRASLVLLVLPVGLVALHPRVLGSLLARLARRDEHQPTAPSLSETARLIVRYVPSWLIVAAATASVARSVTATVDIGQLVVATTLAWLAGFLALGVPGGIGVREAVFVSASGLPESVALAVAVLARLAFIAADGLGAALALLACGIRGGGVPLPGHKSGG